LSFDSTPYKIFRACLVVLLMNSLVNTSFGQYKNLVFEGAGVRGIAYAGALSVLEEKDMLANVEKVSGTSAGAIAALTVALGYTSHEIENIIYNTRIQKFNDGRFIFFGGLSRLNRRYGWYRGIAFTKWVSRIIAQKTRDADITFRQLHERGFRDLYITGTSINNQKLVIFSFETYPDMKVRDAVRISVSIPLYFEPVCVDQWGTVVDPKRAKVPYDIMVDGGFTGNFPIWVFDSVAGEKVDPHTLGFRIDSPAQISYDTTSQRLAPVPVDKLGNYIGGIYNYVIENLNRSSLSEADWTRTVSISSGNIGPKIRKLSIAEKNMLLANGRQAMHAFLQAHTVVTD